MATDIEALLKIDPLLEAEKITGKSYKEDRATSNLGMLLHLTNSEAKRNALKAINDTYFSGPYTHTLSVYLDLGFSVVYDWQFLGIHGTEIYAVLWHPDGILATLESYGEGTNNTHIYFNWRQNEGSEYWPSYSGHGANGVVIGYIDTREGLRTILNRMREEGEFLPKWIEQPWLSFVDYAGYDKNDRTLTSYSQAKDQAYETVIAALPPTVREAITP